MFLYLNLIHMKPQHILLTSILCLLLFPLAGTLSLQAQNITFFTSKQGLVNSCIQTLYEDSRHNIWIGTRNGLNRYDGVKMNTYRHSETDPKGLKAYSVLCVYEYDPEHILIGTNNGLLSYNYATDQFTDVPFITREGDTINIHYVWIGRLSSGKVVACVTGYGSGHIEQDQQGNMAVRQEAIYITGENNSSPVRIVEDKDQRLWILNNGGEVYRKEGKGFKRIDVPERPVALYPSTSGKLYLGCERAGLMAYSKETDSFLPVNSDPVNYNLWDIREWTNGRIFICTDGDGLKVYDERTGKITQSNIRTNDFNLASANVKDALSDAYGNVWVGIYWRGVMMKPINQSAFEYIGRNSITKNTIGTNPVTAIAPADGGKLWVATDHDGIYKLQADGSASHHWPVEGQHNMPSTLNTLLDDHQGTLWMGGYADGFWSMNTQTGTLTRSRHNINRVFHLSREATGNLWIATLGKGFYQYNPRTDELIHYDNRNGNIQPASFIDPNRFVFCIEPMNETLYVGTANGLEVYQKKDKLLIPKEKHLTQRNVLCLRPDKQGNLWIGTTEGLHRLNTQTSTIKTYAEPEGLPNPVVNSIEVLGRNLWLGTDNGLCCLNTETGQIESFYNEDGLQDNEFGQRVSAHVGKSLYFGGIGGITFFQEGGPSRFKSSNTFDIFLVGLFINNTAVNKGDKSGSYNILDAHVDETKMVHLSYLDNHFSVEIAAPSASNHHITYEYSFDGKDWTTQEGNTGRIIIQGLEPGLYHLHIRARTYQSVSRERILTVRIHHPWYTSPLAIIIYLILIALACWGIYLLIRRQVKARQLMRQHQKEQEINEARIQFFMNISHEIRTPMTLIIAPLEKLMGMDKDELHQRNYRLIQQNAKRIVRLVSQMMDVRKIEKGQYRLDYTTADLIPLIQNVCDGFSSATAQRNISLQFQHTVNELFVKIDTENLDKIMMNLLSNAFKFTPDGGNITVSLEAADEQLTLRVIDTGPGIPDPEKPKIFERFYSANKQNGYIGTGIGLNLTYLLVQLMKGTITVQDNPIGRGSMFTLTLPRLEGETSTTSQPSTLDPRPSTLDPRPSTLDLPDLPIEKPRGLKHRNVLVVEDDPNIRQYLHSELSTDMVVAECGNGEEAWNYIQKNPKKIDLVISDRMMPTMDGLTLCQKIKNNPLTNHLPVILITALGSDADRIDGLTGGADAYITKPFNIDVLHTTALNLLRGRLMLQGKYATEQKTEEKIEKLELTSPDEHLMERVMKVINQNMDNSDLSVEAFADMVGVSRVHFYRKIKELTGQSPRDFLKTIRLKEAARLLREKHLDITSVSDATGFKTLSTFSTSFKALYGMTPSEYQNAQLNDSTGA